MKILLLGADGQVGWRLRTTLTVIGEVKACNRKVINLGDGKKLSALIRNFRPNIIVNAAAYTAVDQAESDAENAKKINTSAVKLIATEAKLLDAWLVHYSTDYVFEGNKISPYTEEDDTNPLSVYGESKLGGEKAVVDSDCKHLIFRTSWVYDSRGSNFAKTMIRLAMEKDELSVVSDQIGAPTSAELIAEVTKHCLRQISQDKSTVQNLSGVYHLTPIGETSWYGFAQFVLTEAQAIGFNLRVLPDSIKPISTAEYKTAAIRPQNSRLDTSKLRSSFQLNLPDWSIHVGRMVRELNPSDSL